MSPTGGYPDDEGGDLRGRVSPEDLEAILSGGVTLDPSLDALAALIRSIDLGVEVPAGFAAAQIAAAAAASGGAGFGPPQTRVAPRRRRRLALGGALSGVTAKIIFGTAVALAAGGAAATGILPDPIQSTVADGVAHLGIEIPHPDHEIGTTTSVAPEVIVTTTTSSITSTTGVVGPLLTPTVVGAHHWSSTTCSGDPIALHYEVSGEGELTAADAVGAVEIIEETEDRLEARSADGVWVRIEVRLDVDGTWITEDERRDCDDAGDDDDTADSDDGSDDDTEEGGDDGDGVDAPDESDESGGD